MGEDDFQSEGGRYSERMPDGTKARTGTRPKVVAPLLLLLVLLTVLGRRASEQPQDTLPGEAGPPEGQENSLSRPDAENIRNRAVSVQVKRTPEGKESTPLPPPPHLVFPTEADLPYLIGCLSDPSAKVREDAARALGTFSVSAEEAIPALRAAAESDPDEKVREWAREALLNIRGLDAGQGFRERIEIRR